MPLTVLSYQVGVSERLYTLQLPECRGTPFLKQGQYLKFKGLNGIWTQKHLVPKGTLNHSPKLASLSKWMNARLRDSWL